MAFSSFQTGYSLDPLHLQNDMGESDFARQISSPRPSRARFTFDGAIGKVVR
ncbi:hypothetical protein QF000_005742 [Paraburkholderia atlantica]